MSNEIALLHHGTVYVSNKRVVVGNHVYAVRNITSVALRTRTTSRTVTVVWLAGAALSIITALVAGSYIESTKGFYYTATHWWLCLIAQLAVVVSLGGAAIYFGRKHAKVGRITTAEYDVVLTTSSGEVKILTTMHQDKVEEFVEAVQQAIASH